MAFKSKILYTSDIHGDKEKYLQIIDETISREIDVVIFGGDLTPEEEFAQSIERQADFFKYSFMPVLQKIKNKVPMTQVFLMLGNDDWASNIPILESMAKKGLCKIIHQKKYSLGGEFEIIGYACVPPTPFSIKDFERIDKNGVDYRTQIYTPYISREDKIEKVEVESFLQSLPTIEKDIKRLPHPSNFRKTVYIFHAPPYNTKLDQLHSRKHIGSKAIREFILNKHPLLTLHGHIHESPEISGSYFDLLGQTLCINPGQSGYGGSVHYVTFSLPDIKRTLKHNLFD